MNITKTSVQNLRGERLALALHGELCGDAAVIVCHGMMSSKESPKHIAFAERVAACGLPVLRFDFAGRGESEGSLFELTYSGEVEDLQSVIEWCAAQGIERFGLFGSSMGGAVSFLAAARDERVVAIATLAAVAHPGAIAERYPAQISRWRDQGYIDTDDGPIGSGFLDDAERHDVVSAVSVLLAPILVMHGTADEVVPHSDAHDIACAARRASLVEFEAADHRFTCARDLEEALDEATRFLTGVLKPARNVVGPG